MNELKELLNEYSKEELIDIIDKYDTYIINFYEYHDEGSTPACLDEWILNEYELLKEDY